MNMEEASSSIYSKEKARLEVKNSEVEGECQIREVYTIKIVFWKAILFGLSCILTLGILWMIGYWLPRYKRKFLYEYCGVNQCSHFLIMNSDDQWSIVSRLSVTIESNQEYQKQIGFINRYMKYYYNQVTNQIQVPSLDINQKLQQEQLNKINKNEYIGISNNDDYIQAMNSYGTCGIDIPIPSYAKLVFNEILHPFFIFQCYSVTVWMLDQYFLFSFVIIILTCFGVISNVVITHRNIVELRNMAFYRSEVYQYLPFKSNKFIKQDSTQIVVGQIIYIEANQRVPCDCILLSGECLVNESTLTGESMAVTKRFADQKLVNHKKNLLFEGTSIIQISRRDQTKYGLPCLVIRIGFQTIKGQLIRTIMFPKPHNFKFFKESIQFLMVLGSLTLIGFFIILPGYINRINATTFDIIWQLLQNITITISPALPAAMNFGISYALNRLKNEQIYCISPPRIIMSGRVDTICFDKTGTLTEDGMFLKGYVIDGQYIEKDNIVDHEILKNCELCCHSLVKLNQDIIGDSMELQLFHQVEGQFSSNDDEYYLGTFKRQDSRFGILKRFDFSSELSRMSVIAEDLETKERFLFIKGAPEIIQQLSKSNQSSFENYFQSGYRIISLAYKQLSGENVLSMDRKELEQDVKYLGLCLFQNPLKEQTKKSLLSLKDAKLDIKIVTGDNILTAMAVGEDCQLLNKFIPQGLIDYDQSNIILTFYQLNLQNYEKQQIQQHIINVQPYLNDEQSILTQSNQIQDELVQDSQKQTSDWIALLNQHIHSDLWKNTQYLITGQAFHLLFIQINHQFDYLLQSIYIFARMKPQQKVQLIQLLQQYSQCDNNLLINRQSRIVAMVGDGANDCGALKQADAGLALSDTEASISAPFTSKILNISSFNILLKNGRAALATNFQCFKFIALYSFIQYSQTLILSYQYSMLTDRQYLFIDLFLVTPLFSTLGLTEPYDSLSIQRPASSLFSIQCLMSVIGQAIFTLIALISILIILSQQDFYKGQQTYIDYFKQTGEEIQVAQNVTTLFLFGNFLYIASIMSFSISKPFKKPFYTNIPFTSVVLILWTICLLILHFKSCFEDIFQLDINMPNTWFLFLFVYSQIWSIIFYVWEHIFCVRLYLWWKLRQPMKRASQSSIQDF